MTSSLTEVRYCSKAELYATEIRKVRISFDKKKEKFTRKLA